jgi:RNA polymerase subunit RPABC4/transcription elongation factor Spt4
MPKTICPRCGNANAKANAQGHSVIYCKPCGGFVDLRDDGGGDAYSDDPERSAMAKERGLDTAGRKLSRSGRELRGGL